MAACKASGKFSLEDWVSDGIESTAFISEWLKPEEALHLDSALCNGKSHAAFGKSCKRVDFANSSLTIPLQCLLAEFLHFIERFPEIKNLIIQDLHFARELKHRDNTMPVSEKVKRLKVKGIPDNEDLSVIDKAFPKLESLSLKNGCLLSDHSFSSRQFKVLKELEMEDKWCKQ